MNRKNLTAAVLAGLAGAAGIVGTAIADHDEVFLNPDGLGEVLLYPYYTVNAGNATLMSVVNTTSDAKAVKVRFKEGENSREVLDFNLYLSAWDVWSGAIVNDGGTPTLIIPDNSCTVPYLYLNDTDDDGAGEQVFLDFDYTGDFEDGGSSDIDRAMEGHMEIIEMGTMFDDESYIVKDPKSPAYRPYGSATAATHVNVDGEQVPLDCQMLNDQWSVLAGVPGFWRDEPGAEEKDMDELSGGLFGSASVVNVGQGTLFSYDAQALGDFHDADPFDDNDNGSFDENGDLHVKPGTSFPNLNSGNLYEARVFFSSGESDSPDYDRGIDAVSAVFMHDKIMNEYALGGISAAESEWVITFPTKRWYSDERFAEEDGGTIWINVSDCPYNNDHDNNVNTPNLIGDWIVDPDGDGGIGSVTTEAGKFTGLVKPPACEVDTTDTFYSSDPFTSTFNGEACEEAGFDIWDVNENATPLVPPGDDLPIVSPPPPGGSTPEGVDFLLCYETSVLKFGSSDIFGSRNTHTVNTTNTGGWASIDFGIEDEGDPIHVLFTNDDSNHMIGLPVTGFWAAKFVNGVSFGGVLSNYGGLFDHKGSTKEHFDIKAQ